MRKQIFSSCENVFVWNYVKWLLVVVLDNGTYYELKAKRAPGLFFQLILVLSRVFSSCYARYRTNTCNKGVDVDLVVCVCTRKVCPGGGHRTGHISVGLMAQSSISILFFINLFKYMKKVLVIIIIIGIIVIKSSSFSVQSAGTNFLTT